MRTRNSGTAQEQAVVPVEACHVSHATIPIDGSFDDAVRTDAAANDDAPAGSVLPRHDTSTDDDAVPTDGFLPNASSVDHGSTIHAYGASAINGSYGCCLASNCQKREFRPSKLSSDPGSRRLENERPSRNPRSRA